ncbi:hypothetical protein ABEP13_02955 [Geobacillus stearothermophilus]|uniref:hypothetical protein n=1 Tax=Geobacillus stearothermophilus TaxID=1422 RepID=UPI000A96E561|nr:hypothetical protein [Geobacillus stearothermophilus]MCK7606737.1 hypothetical protein [Geobacillus stearothermophilus]MED3665083.1 hypothetical protein [Geobacillus stearothermophilus]MED3720948.1 hypothetical protein [Geobacillus stearothermophilus]MED3747094.1 hypothetical protein [Geobacillus stearothermophilus]MED3773119.1 hypothetical protein [Geobacillus stearothermophilus]
MAQLETNTSVESLGYKQELKRSLTFALVRPDAVIKGVGSLIFRGDETFFRSRRIT